jgi:hypothetical protein
MLTTGTVNLEEGRMLIKTLNDNYKNFEGKDFEIYFTRKFGISSCFLTGIPNQLFIELNTKIIVKITVSNIIEELKINILNIEG